MDLKERILAYMKEKAYKPLLAEDLAEGMHLTQEELVEFDAALEELEKEGAVIKNRSDLYGIPSRMHLVVGRLSMTAKGFGFIIPDVRASEDETDVFVPGADLNTAMHGDRVVARVAPAVEEGRSREGEIIRILERANEKIVSRSYDSAHLWCVLEKILIAVLLVFQTAHKSSASARYLCRVKRQALLLSHFNGNRLELAQKS